MAQTIRLAPASMPKNMVPLQVAVVGRVQASVSAEGTGSPTSPVVYQWPGTYFRAAFTGRTLYFRIGEGRQGLHLVVDGGPAIPLVSTQASVYRVLGLARGPHTVRLAVVTESQAGPDGFMGFAVPAADALTPAPRRGRQIEFIGDSYTVGYGNTSGKSHCSRDEVWSTTDDSAAFGPLTAEHFGAEYQVNAISGRGVVRNYNGGSSDTLPTVYPFVLFDKKERYHDANWMPQAIVIGLGTNDFSTPLNPGEPWTTRQELHTDFEAKFVTFLKQLRTEHPSAFLILWATDGEHGEVESEAANVVERLRAEGETRVGLVPVSGLQMTGCDEHPSAEDDRDISAHLNEFIDAHPEIWQAKAAPNSRVPRER